MHLRLITELKFGKATKRVRDLLAQLSPNKRKHSRRVGRALHRAGVGKAGVYAGLLHDVLERGVPIEDLLAHAEEYGIPPQAIEIVRALSSDEKNGETHPNEPLAHLMRVLPTIHDPDIRNTILLAKLSDRSDNVKKRIRTKGLSAKYKAKSEELVDYIRSQYNGPWKPMGQLLTKYYQLVQR